MVDLNERRSISLLRSSSDGARRRSIGFVLKEKRSAVFLSRSSHSLSIDPFPPVTGPLRFTLSLQGTFSSQRLSSMKPINLFHTSSANGVLFRASFIVAADVCISGGSLTHGFDCCAPPANEKLVFFLFSHSYERVFRKKTPKRTSRWATPIPRSIFASPSFN